MIRILLNGEPHDLDEATSVASLLHRLGVDPRIVAVELDRAVVKRDRYDTTFIDDRAEVEVVAFVGGG